MVPRAAQHSVHPTGGSLRVFKQFSWLKLVPSKWHYLVPPTSGYRTPLDCKIISEGIQKMQINENWIKIKQLFKQSFRSSFHYAIATVSEQGEPHITPIGSLILGEVGQGVYFEEYPKQLPRNLEKKVCVLAVNSSPWFWMKSLISGWFSDPPAARLYGVAGAVRAATEKEIALLQRRVRRVSSAKVMHYCGKT